ncbi:endonuclease/exonuclease/phosphatase family protein [Parashewanella tropica]|uniref:endonuclease/exonuclease/phosphatase family protein n=1 Tax=Parashewanella tropica TaxID=2547970 RepID=UPI001FE26571|nr:endonuclease/exonuclease/phosphatase family protein [Parashewanella tropica]
MKLKNLAAACFAMAAITACNQKETETNVNQTTLRFATFNASFDRKTATQLADEMAQGTHQQIKNVAEVIQRVRPDVLLLNEFDHDGVGKDDKAVRNFLNNYLAKSHNGSKPIEYPYFYIAPTNTGLAEVDLNGDGKVTVPADTYGFGMYHGQYGFIVLSKYPLKTDQLRSFQTFHWKDMPNAALPVKEDGSNYYSDNTLKYMRLSSKNHIDLPVQIGDEAIHVLAMHPTPPVFDGPEDRNGRRNHDEIRLFSDYISTENHQYLVDDQGNKGGLKPNEAFVIMGDLNADPIDGDSYQRSILQLLKHPRVHQKAAQYVDVPSSKGGSTYKTKKETKGNPAYWTHTFPLRLDYALPSANLTVTGSGVFWPEKDSKLRYLVEDKKGNQGKSVSSDHRLVWVDVTF